MTREKLCNKGTKKHIHFAFFFCFPREQKKEKEFFSSITKGGFVISKKKASLSLSGTGTTQKKTAKNNKRQFFCFGLGVCVLVFSLSPLLFVFLKKVFCVAKVFLFFLIIFVCLFCHCIVVLRV